MPLDPTGHLLHKATLLRPGYIAEYLIHRNKHRELGKMRREGIPSMQKNKRKPQKKNWKIGDKKFTRKSVQSNSHKYGHQTQEKYEWTQWELQWKDKKDVLKIYLKNKKLKWINSRLEDTK